MAGFLFVFFLISGGLKQTSSLVFPDTSMFNYIGMLPQNMKGKLFPAYLHVSSNHPANVTVHAPFLSDRPLFQFIVSSSVMKKLEIAFALHMPVGSTILQKALMMKSNVSVSAILVNTAGDIHNSDAVQLLELLQLGTEYVVLSYHEEQPGSFFAIAAPFDCDVTIKLPSGYPGINVITSSGPVLIGPDVKLVLRAYDVLQIQSSYDLTGTTIVSNKTIAVFAGHNRTVNRGTCKDHVFAQMPKTADIGTDYITFSNKNLEGKDTIRFVSTQNDTTVIRQGLTTLDFPEENTFKDWIPDRNKFYYMHSSKPVLTGCITASDGADPTMWVFTPLPYTCSSYSFTVPDIYDMNYHLVLVILEDHAGGIILNGQPKTPTWVATSGAPYVGCYIDVDGGDVAQSVSHVDGKPFAAYVTGFLKCKSYGFRLAECDLKAETGRTIDVCSNSLNLKKHVKTRFIAYLSESQTTDDFIGCVSACKLHRCYGLNFAAPSTNAQDNCEIFLSREGYYQEAEEWDAHIMYEH